MPISRRWKVAVPAALAAVGGYMVWSTLQLVQVTCEVCMEFRGQMHCQSATGSDEEEALATALRDACTRLASGMTDTIACQQRPPRSTSCSNR